MSNSHCTFFFYKKIVTSNTYLIQIVLHRDSLLKVLIILYFIFAHYIAVCLGTMCSLSKSKL